ncbi:hypothetical protein [Sorangium sp. So ce1182]|uniref:hypothetical protein n=1 Tax=Sorangium sp. So ce1182 TaxID=3133334 RepID=UPI003F5EA628
MDDIPYPRGASHRDSLLSLLSFFLVLFSTSSAQPLLAEARWSRVADALAP